MNKIVNKIKWSKSVNGPKLRNSATRNALPGCECHAKVPWVRFLPSHPDNICCGNLLCGNSSEYEKSGTRDYQIFPKRKFGIHLFQDLMEINFLHSPDYTVLVRSIPESDRVHQQMRPSDECLDHQRRRSFGDECTAGEGQLPCWSLPTCCWHLHRWCRAVLHHRHHHRTNQIWAREIALGKQRGFQIRWKTAMQRYSVNLKHVFYFF